MLTCQLHAHPQACAPAHMHGHIHEHKRVNYPQGDPALVLTTPTPSPCHLVSPQWEFCYFLNINPQFLLSKVTIVAVSHVKAQENHYHPLYHWDLPE